MRALEFLVEYSREITLRTLAPKLLDQARHGQDRRIFGKVGDDDRVLDVVMSQIEHADPTDRMTYVPWIVREYSRGNIRSLEDLPARFSALLQRHHENKLKGDFPVEARDIMRLSADEFEDMMLDYKPPEDEVVDRGTSEDVYSDDDVRVIIPYDEDAACYYGQGTKWCTAATKGENMFDEYAQRGPLYIVIPKHAEYPGEKYQLHFVDRQYMDERDDPVSLDYVIRQRFPQLQEFFLGWHPEIRRQLDDKPTKKPRKKKSVSDVFKQALGKDTE